MLSVTRMKVVAWTENLSDMALWKGENWIIVEFFLFVFQENWRELNFEWSVISCLCFPPLLFCHNGFNSVLIWPAARLQCSPHYVFILFLLLIIVFFCIQLSSSALRSCTMFHAERSVFSALTLRSCQFLSLSCVGMGIKNHFKLRTDNKWELESVLYAANLINSSHQCPDMWCRNEKSRI